MIIVGDFTDSDRIRGVMGFTGRDLPDSQLITMELSIELSIELYEWMPSYATNYDTWYNNGSPTDENQNKINLLLSYCTYQAAYLVCLGLEMIAQRSITDSKMTMARFSNISLSDVRDRMLGRSLRAQTALAELEGITLDTSTPTLFSSASPSFDPVVGE